MPISKVFNHIVNGGVLDQPVLSTDEMYVIHNCNCCTCVANNNIRMYICKMNYALAILQNFQMKQITINTKCKIFTI